MQRMMWSCSVAALATCAAAFLGCSTSGSASGSTPIPFLEDAAYRRASLEASLVNPGNGYSTLRLDHYASGGARDWEKLPEWSPAVSAISLADLDGGDAASAPLSSAARSLDVPNALENEGDPALIELGRRAFHLYPSQLAAELDVALASRDAALRYGLWLDESRGVGGLVRARMGDGRSTVAMTCSTCHSALAAGVLCDGLPNVSLDLGAAVVASGDPGSKTTEGPATWGAGRLDVTTVSATEPARIPDLRAARYQRNWHHDGTLRNLGLTSLAIRIETLIVTAHGDVLRPPRVIALALAAYVQTLADGLPDETTAEATSPRGAELFRGHCASCHVPPAFAGAPVPLDEIGTDPTLGLSADRGTGAYRVPSLRGAGTRGPLLHDGTIASVQSLFDPERLSPTYGARLHGAGAVPGHRFGLQLSEEDRQALVDYVGAL